MATPNRALPRAHLNPPMFKIDLYYQRLCERGWTLDASVVVALVGGLERRASDRRRYSRIRRSPWSAPTGSPVPATSNSPTRAGSPAARPSGSIPAGHFGDQDRDGRRFLRAGGNREGAKGSRRLTEGHLIAGGVSAPTVTVHVKRLGSAVSGARVCMTVGAGARRRSATTEYQTTPPPPAPTNCSRRPAHPIHAPQRQVVVVVRLADRLPPGARSGPQRKLGGVPRPAARDRGRGVASRLTLQELR